MATLHDELTAAEADKTPPQYYLRRVRAELRRMIDLYGAEHTGPWMTGRHHWTTARQALRAHVCRKEPFPRPA